MDQPSTTPATPGKPLTLAVHTLPDVVHPDFVDVPPSGRAKLLAVLFACLLPVLLYFVVIVARPLEHSSFSTLIEPARVMPSIALTDIAGQPATLSAAKPAWRLIGVGPSQCEDRCVKHLFIQRQLREMLLKKNMPIERLWLLTDAGPVPDQLQPLLKNTQTLRATPAQVTEILGVAPEQAASQLFVQDPQGKLVMTMPADQDSAQVRTAMWTLQKKLTQPTSASTGH
jgi:hypothetical protein